MMNKKPPFCIIEVLLDIKSRWISHCLFLLHLFTVCAQLFHMMFMKPIIRINCVFYRCIWHNNHDQKETPLVSWPPTVLWKSWVNDDTCFITQTLRSLIRSAQRMSEYLRKPSPLTSVTRWIKVSNTSTHFLQWVISCQRWESRLVSKRVSGGESPQQELSPGNRKRLRNSFLHRGNQGLNEVLVRSMCFSSQEIIDLDPFLNSQHQHSCHFSCEH